MERTIHVRFSSVSLRVVVIHWTGSREVPAELSVGGMFRGSSKLLGPNSSSTLLGFPVNIACHAWGEVK